MSLHHGWAGAGAAVRIGGVRGAPGPHDRHTSTRRPGRRSGGVRRAGCGGRRAARA